ncbi:MAG: tetratricopeptide repeat protein [Flavobacteriales bacterium]
MKVRVLHKFKRFHKIVLIVALMAASGLTKAQSTEELLNKAREIKFSNPDSAILLAKKAKVLLKKKYDAHKEIAVYNILGLANWALGNTKEADDNLTLALKKAIRINDDTLQTILYNNLGILKRDRAGLKEVVDYHLRALKSAKKSKRPYDIADTYNNIGSVYMYYSRNDSAVYFLEKGLMVYNQRMETDKKAEIGYGDCSTNIGLVYFGEGKYSIAYTYFFKALKIFEKYKLYDKALIAANNIAEIYLDKNDVVNAIKFCRLALSFEKKSPNEMQLIYVNFIMGKIYHDKNQFDSALVFYHLAADGFNKFEMTNQFASVLNSMATAYVRTGNFNKGLSYLNDALKVNIEFKDTVGVCANYSNYATIYLEKGDYLKAEEYILKALHIMRPEFYYSMYTNMLGQAATIEGKLGKYQKAYEYLSQHNICRDSLISIAHERNSEELAQIYQSEKREKELLLAKSDNEKNSIALKHEQEEGKRKSLQLYMALGGSLLLVVLAVFVIRSNLIRKRTNVLLAEKNSIIYEQKAEVELQKAMVEGKNREITDSINYALRIQRAVLPDETYMKEILGEHFVLFKPKDIVSGDFYWAHELANDRALFACGDSTGHGVPGAIMSMLNISALENAVDALKKPTPADILNFARKKIIDTLAQDGNAEGGKDGMDCILIAIDKQKMKVQFAMANNSLWIIRNGEMLEFAADKMPVGKHDRDNVPFTAHEFDLQKGDLIITITDGFPDQFGGARGKKFKYSNLKNILIEDSNNELQGIKSRLHAAFSNWQGDLEQVDDVCVIGIRI